MAPLLSAGMDLRGPKVARPELRGIAAGYRLPEGPDLEEVRKRQQAARERRMWLEEDEKRRKCMEGGGAKEETMAQVKFCNNWKDPNHYYYVDIDMR